MASDGTDSGEAPDDIPRQIPHQIPHEIPHEIPHGVPDQIPHGVPDQIPPRASHAAAPDEHRGQLVDADVPMTGDAEVDEAVVQLAAADPDNLDAQIEAGERVHDTLRSRLSDLGG